MQKVITKEHSNKHSNLIPMIRLQNLRLRVSGAQTRAYGLSFSIKENWAVIEAKKSNESPGISIPFHLRSVDDTA
jgi:hypothetical protein